MNSIEIGTAAYGAEYGKLKKTVSQEEAVLIHEICQLRSDIFSGYDSAKSYPGSYRILKSLTGKRVISTKYKFSQFTCFEDFSQALREDITLLGISRFEAVYIHEPPESHMYSVFCLWVGWINKAKSIGLCTRSAVSMYEPCSVEEYEKIGKPDQIQVPISIVDQRLLQSEIYEYAKERSLRLIGRSVYLQGLLTSGGELNSSFSSGMREYCSELKAYADEMNVTMARLCIDWVKSVSGLSGIILGVTSLREVNELLEHLEQTRCECIPKLVRSLPLTDIDPRRW